MSSGRGPFNYSSSRLWGSCSRGGGGFTTKGGNVEGRVDSGTMLGMGSGGKWFLVGRSKFDTTR